MRGGPTPPSFQSTHPRGVRHKDVTRIRVGDRFQSTHPRGVRPSEVSSLVSQSPVSIHAPTRGATGRLAVATAGRRCFNPRTHAGCDRSLDDLGVCLLRFQSTHPRGVRHWNGKCRRGWACFNPRTHAGCDGRCLNSPYSPAQFQSTHPRGVRHAPRQVPLDSIQFQSTHPRGVRPGEMFLNMEQQSFNPRTHAGCDFCSSSA